MKRAQEANNSSVRGQSSRSFSASSSEAFNPRPKLNRLSKLNEIGSLRTLPTNTVSGGFAIVQPDSQLSINAVEGFPLEEFSADVSLRPACTDRSPTYQLAFLKQAVRSQITEAQKIAGGGGSEQDVAEAKIELEVRTK